MKTKDGSKTSTAHKRSRRQGNANAKSKTANKRNKQMQNTDPEGQCRHEAAGPGIFLRTGGRDASSGRPFVGFGGSGTSFYRTLGIIGDPRAVSSRTFKGQGGSAASLRTTLEHQGRPMRGSSSQVILGDLAAPSGPERLKRCFVREYCVFRSGRPRMGSGSCPDRIFLLNPVQMYVYILICACVYIYIYIHIYR